ncbi:MAG: LD-carboxypeptidase [Burkholderiales bacterium]|nr:LD-carboxypeptidase [Burkholderiales bacterium]
MIRFPKPLRAGDRVAATAPSSGVSGPDLVRLDLVLSHMRNKGFGIVEGACLRAQYKDSSAPLDHRAAELNRFLLDPRIAAILPPWGGELASHHPLRELFAMAAARLAALSP